MRRLLVPTLLLGLGSLPAQQIVWFQCPVNGHFYGVSHPTTSWSGGEALAVSLGGHLATIRSAAEQSWIEATFFSETGPSGLWIGLNDIAVEGQFQWTSGEPVTYTNWAVGNPDNGSDLSEDAVHLFGPVAGIQMWRWNDETEWFSGILRPLIELPGPSAAGSYTPFGSGCLDPFGAAPVLAGAPGEVPRPGTTSHVRVSNLPTTLTLAGFVVGFSTTWDPAGYPLPLDLGVVGWPGCPQLISFGWCDFIATQTGYADYAITVPANYLPGFTFYVQTLVLYFPAGVAVSNAVTGVVGY